MKFLRIFISIFVWLIISATPLIMSAEVPEWAWNTYPKNGQPVFFSCSPRYLNRDEELELCLHDASIQASKYSYLSVYSVSMGMKTTSGTEHLLDCNIDFSKKLAEELKKNLEIIKKYTDESGTYVLYALKSDDIKCFNLYTEVKSPNPVWLNKTPKIDGYYSAVGVARARRLISDSISAADDNALLELLKQLSVRIQSGQVSETGNSLGISYSNTYQERSRAEIKGFYILSRWRTESGDYYYSLVICPENQQ